MLGEFAWEIMRLEKTLDGLRHTAYDKVAAQGVRSPSVQGFGQRCAGSETLSGDLPKAVFSEGPQKFLKVHRAHGDGAFFRRNQNVFDILFD